jgi:osmoprotectant transport system permease protein
MGPGIRNERIVRRIFSVEKVSLTASILGALPLFGFGFVIFRPNRLVSGSAVSLWKTAGDWIGWVIVATWLVLILLTIIKSQDRIRHSLLCLLSCALIPGLLFLAGRHAALVAEIQGPVARVSFGPGFWIPVFALGVIITNSFQRSRGARVILGTAVFLSFSSCLILLVSGRTDSLSLMREFINRRGRFFGELRIHMALAVSSVGIAFLLGVPLGMVAHRVKKLRTPTFFTLNTLQTVPSLALFGILIPVLAALIGRFPVLGKMGISGIGTAPAIIALTAYSLLPVARNTFTGFSTVDPAAVDAGLGMGMTRAQLLWRVELPIASPIILNGIRTALVQAVGLTAVAALIGAGGFGVFIFQGLGQAATDLILLGAVPTIVIAVAADAAMSTLIVIVEPKGLK